MSSLVSFPETAILSLVWLVLSQLMTSLIFFSTKERNVEEHFILSIFHLLLSVTFYLSLPVAGLYADIKFGRFKTAMFNLVLASSMTFLIAVMSVVVDKFKEANLIINIALPISILSHKAFIIVNLCLAQTNSSQQLHTN